ncbi:Hypothetical protein NTJ_11146 [Nesidiocoris tenuis]|uniref:Uncharacterized protein n=1 Tax=Nesidiocoris tenuis TaxID=355587 RepID=A0ABN7B1N4_9HEMI|nr:Hypothetical protein NTJ_11146 [Nesidiocoris tenuis]
MIGPRRFSESRWRGWGVLQFSIQPSSRSNPFQTERPFPTDRRDADGLPLDSAAILSAERRALVCLLHY